MGGRKSQGWEMTKGRKSGCAACGRGGVRWTENSQRRGAQNLLRSYTMGKSRWMRETGPLFKVSGEILHQKKKINESPAKKALGERETRVRNRVGRPKKNSLLTDQQVCVKKKGNKLGWSGKIGGAGGMKGRKWEKKKPEKRVAPLVQKNRPGF